jgi:uncharacterized low-complexity protein
MAGTALIGLGAPAAPSVTTVAVANASNRVQLNGSMATDRANTGSVGQANVGAGPAKTKEGGSSAALRGDSSTEPPAYWLALAGFALVGFVAHRRKPD